MNKPHSVKLNKKALLAWLWVGLCSLAIFLSVPLARRIQIFVSENWGRETFGYFVLVALTIGLLALLYYLIFKLKIRNTSNYIWLFLVTGLYVYFTLKLWKIPEEAVHFLEYGLLGFFLFKALSHHVRDKSIYLTAALLTLFIGMIDEILQWMTPERYWDFKDAGLNGLSGALFQLVVWNVVRPKIISEKINVKSLRIFSVALASCIILLGLCSLNSPKCVATYTKKISWLSFLQKEEPMNEFGYKYKDSEIGSFKSRMKPERLHSIDKNKGEQYAQILNQPTKKDYNEFIREYNPITNPFLYELRIHIFRRDQYFHKSKNATDQDEKSEFLFIAYKENLILQKYFSQSIKESIYAWDANKIQEAENLINKSKSYKSPVSANLVTSFSKKEVWILILLFISLLMIINLILFLKKGHKLNKS